MPVNLAPIPVSSVNMGPNPLRAPAGNNNFVSGLGKVWGSLTDGLSVALDNSFRYQYPYAYTGRYPNYEGVRPDIPDYRTPAPPPTIGTMPAPNGRGITLPPTDTLLIGGGVVLALVIAAFVIARN